MTTISILSPSLHFRDTIKRKGLEPFHYLVYKHHWTATLIQELNNNTVQVRTALQGIKCTKMFGITIKTQNTWHSEPTETTIPATEFNNLAEMTSKQQKRWYLDTIPYHDNLRNHLPVFNH